MDTQNLSDQAYKTPGEFKVESTTVVTETDDPNSAEVRFINPGAILRVSELRQVGPATQGQVADGWVTLRDAHTVFAIPNETVTRKEGDVQDDFSENYHNFGLPGTYTVKRESVMTEMKELSSQEICTVELGKILEVEEVIHVNGWLRGKVTEGWITLRNDYFDTYAKFSGPLSSQGTENQGNVVNRVYPAKFGLPGLYECVQKVLVTNKFDFTRESFANLRIMDVGEVFLVEEVQNLEHVVRGRTSEGWITLRDNYYIYMAKAVGNPMEEDGTQKRAPNNGVSNSGCIGLYECVCPTAVNEHFNFTKSKKALRHLSIGELFNVLEVKSLANVLRGRTDEGWVTLRDSYYIQIAKPVSDIYDLKTLRFESDVLDPWGAKIDSSWHICLWRITELQNGLQCDRAGVDLGWRLMQINDTKLIDENREIALMMLLDGRKCSVLFAVPRKDGPPPEMDLKDLDESPLKSFNNTYRLYSFSGSLKQAASHITLDIDAFTTTTANEGEEAGSPTALPEEEVPEGILQYLSIVTWCTRRCISEVPRRCIKNSLPLIAFILWAIQSIVISIITPIFISLLPVYSISYACYQGSGYGKTDENSLRFVTFVPMLLISQALLIPTIVILIFIFYIFSIIAFLFISQLDGYRACLVGFYDKRNSPEIRSLWWEVYYWAKVEDFVRTAFQKATDFQQCIF